MKKAKLTHEVWIGFPNYEGDIQSIQVIARFGSSQRAVGYIKFLLEEHPYEDDLCPRYGYKKSGEDDFVQIAEMQNGRVHLSNPLWVHEDHDGLGWVKGVVA